MDISTRLHIASKISNDYRVHDRLLKVLQYSCTILVCHGVKNAKDARYTLSTARKAFYLFRSVCHLQNIVVAAANQAGADVMHQIKDHSNMLEQLALAIYYIVENAIYLSRCSINCYGEEVFSASSDATWFAGDAFSLITAAISFRDWCIQDRRKHGPFSEARLRITGLIIAVLDVAVSGHYIGLWKSLFGKKYNPMNEWRAGLGGAVSAGLVLINRSIEIAEKCRQENAVYELENGTVYSSDDERDEIKV